MAQRRHHYEAAFESYLRNRRVPYVAVDEAKRTLLPDDAKLKLGRPGQEDAPLQSIRLKSFDFVVYSTPTHLIVDVKGRKVPRSTKPNRRGRLESWVTREDVAALAAWEQLFGRGFAAWFVFLYWCDEQPPDGLFQEVFTHRNRWYAMRAIDLSSYASSMVTRSQRWGTVHLPTQAFEELSAPFSAGHPASSRS